MRIQISRIPLCYRWECILLYLIWRTKVEYIHVLLSSTLLLIIYPAEMYAPYVHQKTQISKFFIALFILVPNWKQQKCPLAIECINWSVFIPGVYIVTSDWTRVSPSSMNHWFHWSKVKLTQKWPMVLKDTFGSEQWGSNWEEAWGEL